MRGERHRNRSGLSWVVRPRCPGACACQAKVRKMQGLWNRSWWGILVFLDPYDWAYIVHTFLEKASFAGHSVGGFLEQKNLQWK